LEIPWSVIAGSFVFRAADYCSPAVAAGLASGILVRTALNDYKALSLLRLST
jgi:hypothetical protein